MTMTMASQSQPLFQSALTRRAILASFWAVVLIAVPFWWKTTTIKRLPLPSQEVARWQERGACPVRIPIHLALHLDPELHPPSSSPYLVQQILAQLSIASSGEPTNLGTGASANARRQDACIDWSIALDEHRLPPLKEAERIDGAVEYTIEVVPSSDSSSTPSIPSSTLRHAILSEPSSPASLSDSISTQLSALFQLPFSSPSSPSSGSSTLDARAVQYARRVRLVFSLMNEDASRGGAAKGWELSSALEREMGPLLRQLEGLHQFGVESQVQWYAPLAFSPTEVPVSGTQETDAQGTETEARTEAHAQGEKEWLVEWEDLKVFVNSAEWSLASASGTSSFPHRNRNTSSSVSPPSPFSVDNDTDVDADADADADTDTERVLHFILYIPAADRRPLRIRGAPKRSSDAAAAEQQAFLVPQWGGVIIYNPAVPALAADSEEAILHATEDEERSWDADDEWSDDDYEDDAEREGAERTRERSRQKKEEENQRQIQIQSRNQRPSDALDPILDADQLSIPMRIFASQLQTLLGLSSSSSSSSSPSSPQSSSSSAHGPPSPSLPTIFTLDFLTRVRILETARESVDTLTSIVRLVAKIENLGVGKDVRDDVGKALDELEELSSLLSPSSPSRSPSATPLLQRALQTSSLSLSLSSRAFFNPTMLGLLYFPDEHKYAVYTPLFGPVCVPLLVALVREVKGWRGKKGKKGGKEKEGKKEKEE